MWITYRCVLSGTNRKHLVQAAVRLARKLAQNIDELGMKLDLGDKASALASDEELLHAAKNIMRVLAGSAVHPVRKLGVHYAISKRGKKILKVRQARFKSGSQTWRRLCKLGLRNHGTRVVYAGILPHTSFGAALHTPSKGKLKVIQCMLGGGG